MFDLSSVKDLLAVVGGVAVIITPMGRAWVRGAVHSGLTDAPALTALTGRVSVLEVTVARHDEDVRQVPRLVAVLDRMEHTLDELNTTLRERVAKLEGANA